MREARSAGPKAIAARALQVKREAGEPVQCPLTNNHVHDKGKVRSVSAGTQDGLISTAATNASRCFANHVKQQIKKRCSRLIGDALRIESTVQRPTSHQLRTSAALYRCRGGPWLKIGCTGNARRNGATQRALGVVFFLIKCDISC